MSQKFTEIQSLLSCRADVWSDTVLVLIRQDQIIRLQLRLSESIYSRSLCHGTKVYLSSQKAKVIFNLHILHPD